MTYIFKSYFVFIKLYNYSPTYAHFGSLKEMCFPIFKLVALN